MPPKTAPEPEPDEPEGAPSWFGAAVDAAIAKALGGLFDSGKADVTEGTPPAGTPAKPPETDVGGQMRQAVTDVLAEREKATADDNALAAVKEELARVKSLAEKTPRQSRRVERVMGWVLDDD